ncbi:MAG TPA: hypothetical protein VHS03_14300 [Gaiellaceae bacterium]|nr:hypothetical protein [Gaiellaceae bacterium]
MIASASDRTQSFARDLLLEQRVFERIVVQGARVDQKLTELPLGMLRSHALTMVRLRRVR